jgi:hypothetical protein
MSTCTVACLEVAPQPAKHDHEPAMSTNPREPHNSTWRRRAKKTPPASSTTNVRSYQSDLSSTLRLMDASDGAHIARSTSIVSLRCLTKTTGDTAPSPRSPPPNEVAVRGAGEPPPTRASPVMPIIRGTARTLVAWSCPWPRARCRPPFRLPRRRRSPEYTRYVGGGGVRADINVHEVDTSSSGAHAHGGAP